ncbi:MAG TPA: type III pantothenate kinase [Rhodanobacteraceae bacterium]|nr:type III pantothenate kinase [Rhodanobacteraceae bacterium]
MNLLLDLGNSRLKWALHDGRELRVGDPVPWSEPRIETVLRSCWQDLPARRVLAADVVGGERRGHVAQALAASVRAPVDWLCSPASHAGLCNGYRQPAALGIDRFAALLAAHADGRAPCVIAHCGSALVLDALADGGRHLGGLIAPGVTAMRAGLQAAGPALARAADGRVVDCAKSTADAIASGAWQALAGAIERFHRRIAPRLGGAPALLLTGGDAATAAELLGPPAALFEHAVLRGLAAWGEA